MINFSEELSQPQREHKDDVSVSKKCDFFLRKPKSRPLIGYAVQHLGAIR